MDDFQPADGHGRPICGAQRMIPYRLVRRSSRKSLHVQRTTLATQQAMYHQQQVMMQRLAQQQPYPSPNQFPPVTPPPVAPPLGPGGNHPYRQFESLSNRVGSFREG